MNCSLGIGSPKPRPSPLTRPENRTFDTERERGRLRPSPEGYRFASLFPDVIFAPDETEAFYKGKVITITPAGG